MRVAGDPRLAAAAPRPAAMFMPGRADEIADEGMRRPLEQLRRRADLHHAAVVHHDDRVGEGQRLGLVVGDVDHREVELAVQLLQLRAQLPLQLGIDHRQRLVEQDGGDVGADQAAAERDLLLGVGGQPRALRRADGRQVEQLARSRRPAPRSRSRGTPRFFSGKARFCPTVMVS